MRVYCILSTTIWRDDSYSSDLYSSGVLLLVKLTRLSAIAKIEFGALYLLHFE